MNINKYQSPAQGHANLQAQQVLLQQLQQSQQPQQLPPSQQPPYGEGYDYSYRPQQQQPQFAQQPPPPQLFSQPQYPHPPQFAAPRGSAGAGAFLGRPPQPAAPYAINIDNPSLVYWQHQQQLCQVLRNANNIPHFYARQYAANSRKTKNPYSEAKAINLVDATKSIVSVLEEQERAALKKQAANNSALLHNKKLAQGFDDEHMQEEQRMRLKTNGKQLWCQLDLSGQGLVNLLPKLFQYDFLESLYLNNNKLTAVAPTISKLRGLRTLDLLHNRLAEVPAELGMCFNLRYLYLFDNNITQLPQELGNLIELLFLGIEGNPIDLKIANLLAEKGTKEVVLYLRDLRPTFSKPPPREWLVIEDDGEVVDPVTNPDAYTSDKMADPDTFTMVLYNTLCHHYATSTMYKYTPLWALEWDYRRKCLQEEILGFECDVVCMQEVETRTYHEFWTPIMAEFGYKGAFFCKTRSKTMSEADAKKVDGCATFYKLDKFVLVLKQNFEYNSVCMGSEKYKKTKDLFNRFMNKDNVALITFLQHRHSGEKITIANTHLHWDPLFNDVKTLQVGILLEELSGLIKKQQHYTALVPPQPSDIKNALVIICGDFNLDKRSAVYQLFSTGSVTKHEDIEGRDYGRFTDEGFRHNFKIKLAYATLGELPFTNLTPAFTDAIDYIWYSTPTLQVKGLLGKVDEEYASRCIGFPNAHFPSDHIPLVTKFQIKKATGAKKVEFKPDFKSGSSRKT